MLSSDDLKLIFQSFEIKEGSLVFLESANLEGVIGGAETVVGALKEIIGDQGTIISFGRGYNQEPSYYKAQIWEGVSTNKVREFMPEFNERTLDFFVSDPICANLMKRPDAIWSKQHGNLFVGVGKLASAICGYQPLHFPLGQSSPAERLVQLQATGVMINLGLKDGLILKHLLQFDPKKSIRLNHFKPYQETDARHYMEVDIGKASSLDIYSDAHFRALFDQVVVGGCNFIKYSLAQVYTEGRLLLDEEK